jgi:hypothetical protein
MSGAAVMRSCGSSDLQVWALGTGSNSSGDAFAVIQAGVNTFGAVQGNTSLDGQSVARASWRLLIPGADAALNERCACSGGRLSLEGALQGARQ